ncbi:SDR family NAD(P)-dependent oxidoreductase [Streptomyces sp. NPDC058001]|uniref:SDR family NAD(P)-dependent oxidoreductase n=1 Tax=Streptomyces sp. NPDC058001 TaxID=3346300 RepID=UPI0036E173EA
MGEFTGRVAIVTGGANGMGERVAHTLAAGGATVVVADKDGERSKLVVAEIAEAGGDAVALPADVSEEEQVAALVDDVVRRYGRVDILDNNAAALELTAVDPDLLGVTTDVFLGTLRGNLLGPFLCTKYVLPVMLQQGAGAIVNMASVSGMAGETSLTAYGVSKAAVIQLTRATAVQYGKRGIRCNAVAPSIVLTRNTDAWAPQAVKDAYLRHNVTPYLGLPQDIAEVVAFLVSDKARYMTGHVIPVDGGLRAAHPIAADLRDT